MLPSLPPIIKADNGPNKIVPNANTAARQCVEPIGGEWRREAGLARGTAGRCAGADECGAACGFDHSDFSIAVAVAVATVGIHCIRGAGHSRAHRGGAASAHGGCSSASRSGADARKPAGNVDRAEEDPHRRDPARSNGCQRSDRFRRRDDAVSAAAAPATDVGRPARSGSASRAGTGATGRRQRPDVDRSFVGRRAGAGAATDPDSFGAADLAQYLAPVATRQLRRAAAMRCKSPRSAARPRPSRRSGAEGQISGPARRPRADRPPRRSRRQGRLLPRPGRPLCLDGAGRSTVLQPEGCRRQLHRPKELTRRALDPCDGAHAKRPKCVPSSPALRDLR